MSIAAMARHFAVEHVDHCPLCESGDLRPFGAVAEDAVGLHSRQSQCRSCGLLVANPRVVEADRNQYYGTAYYEEQWPDAERVIAENLTTHAVHDVSLIERIAGARLERGRALDVGSGYGATVHVLRAKGFRAFGAEMSWRGCAFARKKGAAVARAKAPGLPFGDAVFDLVTAAHVIEHVGDPHAFVSELARVTVPGGVIAIVTDHATASQHLWNRVCARAALRPPPFQTSTDHTFVFGVDHLRRLFERADCETLDVAVYHHAAPRESWHWRAYKSTLRLVDHMLGWGPYQLAVGVRRG